MHTSDHPSHRLKTLYVFLAIGNLSMVGLSVGLLDRSEQAGYERLARNGAFAMALISLLVVAGTAYLIRMARAIGSAREREHSVRELREREKDLKAAIVERDRQHKMLIDREELLIEAEQLATIGTWQWDIARDEVQWSDELHRIFGDPAHHLAPTLEVYFSRIHPDDREAVARVVGAARESGDRMAFDHRIVGYDGVVRLGRVKARVERDSGGQATRILGVVQDVTEQEAAQAKLRRKEMQLEEAQRIAKIGSWDFTSLTGESNWSDELYRILGCDPRITDPSLETYVAFLHPDDLAAFVTEQAENAAAQRPRLNHQHRLVRTDGQVIDVVMQGVIEWSDEGHLLSILGTVQDVTERKQAELSLRQSQERFALAALATNDVIWDYDPATRKIWYTDAFPRLFGHSEAEDGVYDVEIWSDNIHPEDRPRIAASFADAVGSGAQYWSGEYRLRTATGEWRDVLDRGYVVRNAEGAVIRFIGATMDVTERNRAAREIAGVHRQLKLVLDSAAEGIFGLSLDGSINFANEAGGRILGWNVHELVGASMHQLVHPSLEDGAPLLAEDCPIETTLAAGAGFRKTDFFWRRDGSSLPVEWAATPMLDDAGRIIGGVVTFSDITHRLAIERMKDEFVSTVSHELRTPLTSIRGALGLIAGGRVGVLPEKAQRMLEIAVGNTNRLVKLINDILDIERLESGAITLSPRRCSTRELIAQTIEEVRPLFERAGIQVTAESASDAVHADPDRLVQTFTNLLSNAIKFSPAQSTIHVDARRRAGEIVFSVRDQGRGIPAEKRDSIFDRFQQVDASDSRDKGGSGLGLAICRSIVRQHGGRIWVESEEDRGSTFFFTIPAAPAACRTILLCGGDDASRAATDSLLTRLSFGALGVACGEDLLRALDTATPDIILLDCDLPDMSVFEALRRIRGRASLTAVPVVIAGDADVSVAAMDGGCTILRKPLSERALLDALGAVNRAAGRPEAAHD